MGNKITMNSSTLMNKIFELVEAQKIWSSKDKVEIIIHPNSLVHTILELKKDQKINLSQYFNEIPLANAIFEGDFNIEEFYKKMTLKFEDLIFRRVNKKIFPAIKLNIKLMNTHQHQLL